MTAKTWIILLFYYTFGICDSKSSALHEVNGTIRNNQTLNRKDGPYLVTSDLIIAENVTLHVEAGAEVRVVPNVGIHVHGTLFAKGTHSQRITFRAIPCNETEYCNSTNFYGTKFYNPGIRLVDGTSYINGRIELERNGQWGAICGNHWTYENTMVACRQLGFLGVTRYYFNAFRSGSVLIRSVSCSGDEESLWRCRYYNMGSSSCRYYHQVSIECHTSTHFLREKVYWKGIHFSPLEPSRKQGDSSLEHVASLEHVDIINAAEGIKALEKAPSLFNVTIRDGLTGLLANNLQNSLEIVDSEIFRNHYAGINVTSSGGPVMIHNVAARDSSFGDGFVYKQVLQSSLDFCSILPLEVSFPLILDATGKPFPVNCSKIFRAPPGKTLSVHFLTIAGSSFECNVTDEGTGNKTLLGRISAAYNGKTVKTGSSSVLEIYFNSKGNARDPANVKMAIIIDQGPHGASVMISKSKFCNNLKTGITVDYLIGHFQISDTTVMENGGIGLHIMDTHGTLSVISSSFLHNKRNGVNMERITGSVGFATVNSSKNQAAGIAINRGTISLVMTDSISESNADHGLFISNQVNSTFNISNTQFINSISGRGIYWHDFTEDCIVQLSKISSSGNSRQSGAYFYRLSASSVVLTSSSFNDNGYHGLSVAEVFADQFTLRNISTSANHQSGIYITEGNTLLTVDSWYSIGNNKNGFYLSKQEGRVNLKDCVIKANRLDGVVAVDNLNVVLESFYVENCTVAYNRYGMLFKVSYSRSLLRYVVNIANSTIANNSQGGCKLYPEGCVAYYSENRRVELSFMGNKLTGNQNYGLRLNGPKTYEINATIKNNLMQENTGYALEVDFKGTYCNDFYPFPVLMNVLDNTFIKNTGEYIILVEFKTLPSERYMLIKNNTFLWNKVFRSFSTSYIRTKTQAVLTIGEGKFTVEHNYFDNPSFPHEMATLIKDHERVFQAQENWWGSRDECEVRARIFEFEDRVELAQIRYYPFLIEHSPTNLTLHNGTRAICFLQGNKLGGTLSQSVIVPRQSASYQVIGDVIVLLNGNLTIEEGVTLEFPLQSVFLVYGSVVIKGTLTEQVKFVPRSHSQNEIRLVGGAGPWEGKLEILLNNTWMQVCLSRYRYESTIVCRQLGYEGNDYRYLYSSGKESAFLHDVRCDTDKNDNIARCNRQYWTSSSSCPTYRYVAYINCKIPYWSGIHLAITTMKSIITNLEIRYAGYAYRNDLSVPGIALRVDHSHHNILGITVDNSASIGIQIMYPDPFKNSYDLMSTTISNSKSDGIRLESPFVKIENANVLNTKGRGFLSDFNWNSLNTHTVKMASEKVKKVFDICSSSNIFFDSSNLLYYLVVKTESASLCESVIAVPKGYCIGMQLIYHDLNFAFHVYKGTNKLPGTLWDIHSLTWSSRPVWLANTSSILLESIRGQVRSVHFMLYLIKDIKNIDVETPNLVISSGNFIGNTLGGIVLSNGRDILGNVTIQDSVIRDSPESGIQTGFSKIDFLQLLNCSLTGNNYGIKLSSFSGKVTLDNTTISNSTNSALYVPSYGQKVVQVTYCRIVHNKGYGIHLQGSYNYGKLGLFVSNTFYGWNQAASVYSDVGSAGYGSGIPIASVINCTFHMNRGPVINIKESIYLSPWDITGNIFMNNTQLTVIKIATNAWNPSIYVRNNTFLFNKFQEKGVIYVIGKTEELVIARNRFEGNSGRSVYLEAPSYTPMTVKNNIFYNNKCYQRGVIEIETIDEELKIIANTFESNVGLFMIFLHSDYQIKLQMSTKNLTFTNNTLVNNAMVMPRSLSCELNFSGIIEQKEVFIRHNIFNSSSFTKELCVNIYASSSTSSLDVSFNFWGFDVDSEIMGRIVDAEINYEHALAVFRPFINSSGRVVFGSNKTSSFEAKSVLGGRLSSVVHLKREYSPYKVISDLTVLPSASLIIDPGVEVQFGHGVGMLVIGSLFVNGNETHPVTFSLSQNNQSGASVPVRLVGGTLPWQGRVEIMYNKYWTPLCLNETMAVKMSNAKVLCRQLGYGTPSFLDQHIIESGQMSPAAKPFTIRSYCHGNESDIIRCPLTFHNRSCTSPRSAILSCDGGVTWGNIRFVRELKRPHNLPLSRLQHLKIEHCGRKHGKVVAAIELFQYVPELSSVLVQNCTAGGLKVWFPEREVHLKDVLIKNTVGYGVEVSSMEQNITLENVSAINNGHGVAFIEATGQWIDGLSYGQVMLCASETLVSLSEGDVFLYFKPPFAAFHDPGVSCFKVVRAGSNDGLAIKLLVMKNVEYISIHDPHKNEILKYSTQDLGPSSRRRLIPWNSITVYFKGWFNTSEVLVHIQRVENKTNFPCTFETSDCGWKDYPSSRLGSQTLNSRWSRSRRGDHTYSYSHRAGNCMYIAARHHWHGGLSGAFTSLPIFKDHDYCFLVFYYKMSLDRYELLSVYIEDLSSKNVTILWSTKENMLNWKKIVLKLPSTSTNYSVILLGYIGDSYGWNSRFVYVDDIQFKRCGSVPTLTHSIKESTISGSLGRAISYTTTQKGKHIFAIEHSKIMNNGLNAFNQRKSQGAIYLNSAKQVFQMFNNYVAENQNGGVVSIVVNEETDVSLPNSFIHANTFIANRGGALHLERISGPYGNVKVTNNYFSLNLGIDLDGKVHTIFNVSNLVTLMQGNLFYNNSGKYIVQYYYPGGSDAGLAFNNNTLIRNHGLGVNYGVTILCNGKAEMHYNFIQNPRNRYQFSTTFQGSPVTVNATSNWWGERLLRLVSPLIMDKTKDYRLSLTVIFQPFITLQPVSVMSASCPPEWLKDNELCFLYKGCSFTFKEARKYCESYGGNVIAMFTEGDEELVEMLRHKESIVRSIVVPSLWVMQRPTYNSQLQAGNGICSVVNSYGNVTQSQCDRLRPFICVRRPVVHCPNGCFHNGDCIGAICFCYPGWTGKDCSQFHCHDLHNCSGNGQCMGPNVCKCFPGYLGLGCTYSFCGKYENCSDCVMDPFCGWCDGLRSCVGGFAEGPPKIRCPGWFYYHCYTVGDGRNCSSNIPKVDCKGRQCNFEYGIATLESCQKCRDLDKCYKNSEEGQCRAWNETRCPGGQIQVDYTDSQRVNNVQLSNKLKIVQPNTTTIYACSVLVEEQQKKALIFVAPQILDVKEGDILCSPQAGGIMHRIVTEVSNGPFKVMLSSPAGLEEVIDYADFKQEASVEFMEDESTLEDEPDEQDLQDLIAGNMTVNESRIVIISGATYKCLGHTYDVHDVTIHSFYLVIENNQSTPRTGDIVVSNTSDGFIETVVTVHDPTEDTIYLETKLQRCNERSQFSSARLEQSARQFSKSAFCGGGDNNPGLIVTPTGETGPQFAVNDSIVGRPSSGFIAKVIRIHLGGQFVLAEVISADLDVNGTIRTAVDVSQLLTHHRRIKRSTGSDRKATYISIFNPRQITHKMISSANAKLEARLRLTLSLTAFVDIEKTWRGKIKDASLGLTLEGSMDSSLVMSVSGRISYSGSLPTMPRKQLGGTKYIKFGLIPIPAGIFLEFTGTATAEVSGSLFQSVSASGRLSLGGKCRWSRGSCFNTDNVVSLDSHWNRPKPNVATGARFDVTVTPTISIQMPVAPKVKGKSSPSDIFKKLVGKIVDLVDLSVSIYARAPLRAGMEFTYPSSQCRGKTPGEVQSYYGLYDLIFGVSVSFVGKSLDFSVSTGFSRLKSASACVCPLGKEKVCVGGGQGRPPKPRPPPSGPPPTKKKRRKRNNGNGKGKTPGPPCGTDYACAGMTIGPDCEQADAEALENCSGNGTPQLGPTCGAYCDCFGGWEGEYCEIISARGGGDPHLETLDGSNFDFFGIGEFWGCRSQKKDFGLQFRLFYYERASLIGGVALKAGRSLVTVMTIQTEKRRDPPIVRIDGIVINVTNNFSEPIKVDNGSVLMYGHVLSTHKDEDSNVVLLSLQYESGLTVTIDVKHSAVMKRQYLNVLYSPTADFKGYTEGLCGLMDNNATNDFMGADGTLYEDAVQFSETWRITHSHSGSGTRDSWSWTSSNFYPKDTMDLSYTDPLFHPIYSLQGIPQSLLELATSMCRSMNISGNNLQSCIYDVAVTNDTTFTDQEEFKQGCPDKCSGKGRCVNGTCRCIEGWTGKSCSRGSCLNCSSVHGNCVKGFCVCDLGWEGRSCESEATCHNVNNCTDPVHGACKTTDVCQCNHGHVGLDCSTIPTCHRVSNCSGNGLCIDFDVCMCDHGWNGTDCTQYSCEKVNYCSEHGQCIAFDTCVCDYGWTGASCALPDCTTVNQCSGKGKCIASNICRCYPGYIGANCSELADCSELANCSGNGVCVSLDSLNVSCSCYAGFSGPNCSQPTCTSLNNCSGNGTCMEAELCKCNLGYNGTDCSKFSCEAVNYCSGNGQCVGYDLCKCNSSWTGPACNVPDCSAVNNCSGQGDCILVNTCACYPSFDGKFCDQKAKPNANQPKFEKQFYNATIMENSPAGTLILQVYANDSDLGRNGQLFYSALGNKKSENLIVVDGATGKVSNTFVFDLETMEDASFNVTLMASDNGFPQKSGVTVVQITVADENDNCPTFVEPSGILSIDLQLSDTKPGDILTKVSATDLDNGINSEITYAISNDDAFAIDPTTGVITMTSNVKETEYRLTVGAADHGELSCLTEISLRVKVTGSITTKPSLTTKPSTKVPSYITDTTPDKPNTSSSSERPADTEHTLTSTLSSLPTEATAASQKNLKYVVIGVSSAGGLLILIIVALIMRKCVFKSRRQPAAKTREVGARDNASLKVDFELSPM